MKFCPVVPEIFRGQVHVPKKERRRRIIIIIRNGAKTISLPTLFGRLNNNQMSCFFFLYLMLILNTGYNNNTHSRYNNLNLVTRMTNGCSDLFFFYIMILNEIVVILELAIY